MSHKVSTILETCVILVFYEIQQVLNNFQMFEKFSNLDVDSAGRGGEYTVQVWTS